MSTTGRQPPLRTTEVNRPSLARGPAGRGREDGAGPGGVMPSNTTAV